METHLENVPDHVDARKVRQALRCYARRLRIASGVSVTIRWAPLGTILGELSIADTNQPRRFTVSLNSKVRGSGIYLTLAHEMVHVRQWSRGHLKDLPPNRVLWRGKPRRWDLETLTYWDSPWEVEARGLEHALCARFQVEHGYKRRDLQARKAA